jgi:hypothetical protein
MSNENYTFFFKDGYYVTFSLQKHEYEATKIAISSGLTHVFLPNYIIALADVRYIAKQKQEEAVSAVPEELEQDVYEYLKYIEREMKDGEAKEGY